MITRAEAIKVLKDRVDAKMCSYTSIVDGVTYYTEDMKEIYRMAIKALESYNKIIEQLEDEEEYAYADFGAYADEYGLDEEYDFWFHKGLQRAIEVIKKEISNDDR